VEKLLSGDNIKVIERLGVSLCDRDYVWQVKGTLGETW
jgi:hypothetical protein